MSAQNGVYLMERGEEGRTRVNVYFAFLRTGARARPALIRIIFIILTYYNSCVEFSSLVLILIYRSLAYAIINLFSAASPIRHY